MIYLPLKDLVIDILTKHLYGTFGDENPELIKAFGFRDRFRVIADTEMFNAKEDAFVFAQEKGDIDKIYQVYFDGEFMFQMTQRDNEASVVLKFFRAFKEKYSNGTIKLIKDEYKIDREVAEMKKNDIVKKVKDIKAKNKTEEMAKEVLLNVVKEKDALDITS